MILKGSQRGGARQMARHLVNGEQNEHVTVHQIRGFLGETVEDALAEVHALSRGTQCRQFLYSLSLNPPAHEDVPVEIFEKALKEIEDRLGLKDQPRVVVFHEKEGRRHAHCVWSRIDVDEMKAINLSFDHRKLQAVSRQLYLEHGWQMPKGLMDPEYRNPLNFTREEWQQALRTGQSAKSIKACLQQCWAVSDSRKAFETALLERGYHLARGNRRAYVAVDVYGEVYSLPRQLGLKAKDLKARLGDPKDLPSVDEIKEKVKGEIETLFTKYRAELRKRQDHETRPLQRIRKTMTQQHRKDREALKEYQQKRWAEEEKRRAARIRKGFKGLWDKLSGRYWKLRKQNEKEAWQCHVRDREERQEVIEIQLDQRRKLQQQIEALRKKHEKETQGLIADLAKILKPSPDTSDKDATPEVLKDSGKAHLVDTGAHQPVSLKKAKSKRPGKGASQDAEPDQ